MQINSLKDFLEQVFYLYNQGVKNPQSMFEVYFELLYRPGITYNFNQAFKDLFAEYKYKTLPSGAELKKYLDKNIVENEKTKSESGTIIAVQKCSSGKEYIYPWAYGGNCPDLETTKKDLFKKGLVIRQIIKDN